MTYRLSISDKIFIQICYQILWIFSVRVIGIGSEFSPCDSAHPGLSIDVSFDPIRKNKHRAYNSGPCAKGQVYLNWVPHSRPLPRAKAFVPKAIPVNPTWGVLFGLGNH
jgi:hypothetical protein